MFSGQQRKDFVEVRSQFVRCARFAGIITCNGQSAAQTFTPMFKPAYVITLPAME
jgi:hypothetical protein